MRFSGGVSVLAVMAALWPAGVRAADFTVENGQTLTSRQTLNPGESGTVKAGGTVRITSGGNEAVRTAGSGGSVTIDNSGTIEQLGTARAVRSQSTSTILILNNSGTIGAVGDDTVKTAAETRVTNHGTIWQKGTTPGSGQALDLRDATGGFVVNGSDTNRAATIRADGDDALRPGTNMTVTNYGTIVTNGTVNTKCPDYLGAACAGAPSAHDAIDVGGNRGVTIENHGTISGSRHGVTADNEITVRNYADGTIVGRNGSGVGSDGDGTVINYGLISGDYAGAGKAYNHAGTGATVNNGDGDGVDIDGRATIVNYGTIRGTGAGGVDNGGLPNGSEGIAAGGGSIQNLTRSSLISGAQNGILVDNGSAGPGVAATTVVNEGTIVGVTGYGIRLIGAFDNTITNSGTITGGNGTAIAFGDGNDTLNILTGSVINGLVDGGAGTNAVALNGTGTFAGAVNFQTLTVDAGTWTLTGTQSYANGVTVRSGAEAIVPGTLGNLVTVASGGRLSGTGRLGALDLSGTIAPTGYAAMAITGNATFRAGSVLQIQANAAGQSGSLAAGGSASILGGTVRVTAAPGAYAPATAYSILTATGGVTGTFSGVSTDLAFLNPSLAYSANAVTLTLARNATLFGAVAATPNQAAVAAAFDRAPTNNALYLGLVGQSASGARRSFDQLSGEGLTGAQGAALFAGAGFSGSLAEQAEGWRSGRSASGTLEMTSGPSLTGYASKNSPREPALIGPIGPAPSTWRVWALGFGGTARIGQDTQSGAAGQSASVGGGAVGFDYQASANLLLGAAAGGSGSSFSSSARSTSGSADGFHAGVYGTYRADLFYVAGSLAYSHFDQRSQRTIFALGLADRAIGRFGADEIRGRIEIGHDIRFGTAKITPYAAIEAAQLQTGGFVEQNQGGALGLAVRGRTTSSLPFTLGARLSETFDLGGGMSVTPMVGLAWIHEFERDRDLRAGLVSVPASSFLTQGPRAVANVMQVRAGLDLAVTRNVSVFAGFNSEFAERTSGYAGRGGLRVTW